MFTTPTGANVVTEIDLDTLLAGNEGYSSSYTGRAFTTSVKSGAPLWVRFLTAPDTMREDGGWHALRLVNAFDGIRGAHGALELPDGMKQFPVFDQVWVDEGGVKKRRDAPKGHDWLLDLVQPSSKYPPKDGRARGSDILAANVVRQDGTHSILLLSGKHGRYIIETFKSMAALQDEFDPTDYGWMLGKSGEGAGTTYTCVPQKNPPVMDLPDTVDLREHFAQTRADVEQWVLGMINGPATADPVASAVLGGGDTAMAGLEASVAPQPQAGPPVPAQALPPADDVMPAAAPVASSDPATYFSGLTAPKMRAALKAAGVEVPDKAPRSQLVELAVQNLPVPLV